MDTNNWADGWIGECQDDIAVLVSVFSHACVVGRCLWPRPRPLVARRTRAKSVSTSPHPRVCSSSVAKRGSCYTLRVRVSCTRWAATALRSPTVLRWTDFLPWDLPRTPPRLVGCQCPVITLELWLQVIVLFYLFFGYHELSS